ncbi:HEPN domain-containing protein [Dysgonomonas sp. ZJ709]|uniref:HEPN domain-containing protein n=1 Tax=Dysgonomonas sp. ZJ709 TaxID=2709797 RepID=UPI0013EAFC56|nr:HEPN domain-containing protein [Dysgonomonas sp. ZJ709]
MDKEDLLKISKADLASSKVLYDNGIYHQAFSTFHQSVEKATKFLALSVGGISEKDLKNKMSHNGIKLFEELFRILASRVDFIPIDEIKSNDFKMLIGQMNEMTDPERVAFIKEEIQSHVLAPYPIPINDLSMPLQLVLDYMKQLGVTDERIVGPMKECDYRYLEKRMMTSTLNTIITVNFTGKAIPLLFSFTVFTNYFRADELRYPTLKLGNPTEYFSKSNVYVLELPFFIVMFGKTLEILEKINWTIEDIPLKE